MEEEINTWGGPRKNSGRKAIKDKRQPLTVYLRPSDVKRKGGKEKVKTALVSFVEA